MKISDITQRSQVQHIAEGRKQLDEAGLVGMGASAAMKALQAAGIIGTGVEAAKNFYAWWDDKISAKELIARTGGDLALGLGAGAGVAGLKSAWRTGKKLLGKGDNVRDIRRLQRAAQSELRNQQNRLDNLKSRTDSRTDLTPAGRRTREKIIANDPKKLAAVADLKAANTRLRNTQGTKIKDFLNYGTAGLGVPDMLDLAQDPTYKALGGADPTGQPKAGESLADAEARRKEDAARVQKRAAERASRYKSDYITKGITTIDPQ